MIKIKPLFLTALALSIVGCSFNYGDGEEDRNRPDIVMENIEYVRFRGGDPLVRFRAEYAERWEERQIMEIRAFSFEQFDNDEISARGNAGTARVELVSGDVFLREGVTVSIESEDIVITTSELDWRDRDRNLSGPQNGEVKVERSDGTTFTGQGFIANTRTRVWEFTGEVSGTYVESENEENS